jgi:hypothetical protein
VDDPANPLVAAVIDPIPIPIPDGTVG